MNSVNTLAISALLASLMILAIGASVLLRDRTRRTYTSFVAFTFMVSAWHLCNFIAIETKQPSVEWLAMWPAATIPPVALRFFREFLADPSIGGTRKPPRVTLVWTVAAYLALTYSAVFHPIHTHSWFQYPFGIYVYGGLYRCMWELYHQHSATTTRVARTRISYLIVGGLVAITLSALHTAPWFGTAWPTIGNFLSILYLYFLSQTLFRYRLLDINELLGKMVVLGTLVVLLWAVYGLLLAFVGEGEVEGLYMLNALVASFVILILFEPVRTRLENLINRWLLRQRHELRGAIADVRRELASATDAANMAKRIVEATEESGRLTHTSVYLIDSDGAGYDLINWFGPAAPVDRVEAAGRRAFIDRLRAGPISLEIVKAERALIDAEEASAAEGEPLDQVISSLEDVGASLVVPIFGSEETEQGPWLLGFLAFKDDRLEEAFDIDDIDVFRRLAGQAALTLESAQVLERVKERDRLAAVGEMSAGLAHEIRNPLGAIKGAAQLLVGPDGKPLELNEGTGEFLKIIIEEVDRLNNVVTQFLDYARPSRTTSENNELDVNEVVKKIVQLMETYEGMANVDLDVRLDELLPPVAADAEQLRQVFLNLGLNALQAMPDGGRLEIITTRRRRSRLGYGSFAEIRFRDSGVGIPRDKLRNLFIPFFTTKARGTGLGLAISQRIVAQYGGTIEVRSYPGKGSTFSVFLPALGPSLPSKPKENPQTAATQPMVGFRSPGRASSTSPPPEPVAEAGEQPEPDPAADVDGKPATS